MTFVERPNENEKNRALSYVAKLIDEAINSKEDRTEDIKELKDIQTLLSTKKYGLVWEQHTEKFEEELKTVIPIFREECTKKINDNKFSEDFNYLLEGDNLHSLNLLEKTHAGKIDVIYIDPPYNTGKKDFKYNDIFIDKSDNFIHSKWLSFMDRRLRIAKKLLADDGLIFISIDDNEQSQLKLLLNEIFGEKNFATQFIIENNPKGRKNSNFSSVTCEYVLCYAKNISAASFKENIPKPEKDMKLDENNKYVHASGRRVIMGENKFNKKVSDYGSNKHFSLYLNRSTHEYFFKKELSINEIDSKLISRGFNRYVSYKNDTFVENTYTQSKMDALLKSNSLDITENKIYEKNFRSTTRIKNIITNKKYRGIVNNKPTDYEIDLKTTSAKQKLSDLFDGKNVFDYPKNVGLLKLLFTLKSDDITILDFFSGSGTTGQAVVELNQEDGGNRKFILATNNENKIAEEVTYERMKRVSSGTEKYEAHPINLKYFKTDFIDKQADDLENSLLANVKTLIELKHGIDLSNSEVAIVTKRSDIKKLEISNLETVYMRKQTHKMLNRQQLEELKEIKIIDIPETFFPLEMKEAGL